MTPDEQPQPVAWVRYKQGLDTYIDYPPDPKIQGSGWTPLYAHPPTSAASQPDAVRVTDEMVEAACAKYHDAWELFDPWTRKWHLVFMRSVLEAAINPPAESAARGDVK